MKFLSWMWLPPIFLSFLGLALDPRGHNGEIHMLLAGPAAIWLVIDVPITFVYVIARVIRRASSDSRPPR